MSADKMYPYGLPLGHRNLGLPTEYDYHQAMVQHACGNMMSTGLNLSMNSGSTSRGAVNGGGKIKKKLKINKDGVPAPKRATTAYINFTQWYREEQKRTGRQIPKIGEFGKECADKWNGMTGEEKQPFLEVAARDRERYKKEMAIFKPARDANKPKRPGTAFMLYMADLRKEMAGKEPEGGVAALAKLGGERWRGMTDDDKRKYVEKQGEEKVRYEANMEEYRKQQSLTNVPPLRPQLEEPVNENSNSMELPSVPSQLPQLSQASADSCDSSPETTHSNSASPPTLSPEPENSSMAALTQFTNPMSLSQAMAMGYAQHTLSLLHNPPAHTTFSSSNYLTQSSPTYNQSFNWN